MVLWSQCIAWPNNCSENTMPDSTVRVSSTKPNPIRRNSSFSMVSSAGSWSSALPSQPPAARRWRAYAGALPAAPSAPRGRRRWSACCRPASPPRYASRQPGLVLQWHQAAGKQRRQHHRHGRARHHQQAQAVEREIAVFQPVGGHRDPQRGRQHDRKPEPQRARQRPPCRPTARRHAASHPSQVVPPAEIAVRCAPAGRRRRHRSAQPGRKESFASRKFTPCHPAGDVRAPLACPKPRTPTRIG